MSNEYETLIELIGKRVDDAINHHEFSMGNNIAGFSVCAGYLAAILAQLRSPQQSLSDEQVAEAYERGIKNVVSHANKEINNTEKYLASR